MMTSFTENGICIILATTLYNDRWSNGRRDIYRNVILLSIVLLCHIIGKSAMDNTSTSVQLQLSTTLLYHTNDNETALEPTTFINHIWVTATLPHTVPYTIQLPDRSRAFIKVTHVTDYEPGLINIHFLEL